MSKDVGVRKGHDLGGGSAATGLRVGARVIVTRGHSKGEYGVITNSPGKVFNGWTVKLDNGRWFGVAEYEMRAES